MYILRVYVKLTIFLMLSIFPICPKYYCTQLYYYTIVLKRSFSFNKLKIEKVQFFTQSPIKIFCINIFKVGHCLASCLAFRPFLVLDS